jgi:pyochelin synthetase
VLHATVNVEQVLARLRELLAAEGWLVALEMTRDHYQIMTSLELLVRLDETVADFTDARQGSDRVFLGRDEWQAALTAAGADIALCLPRADPFIDELGMCVLAGRFKGQRARLSVADVTAHLAERLPEYMVPAVIQIVDGLPLTANGKVDRRTLVGWAPRRGADRAPVVDVAPRTDLEEAVAAIWAQALNMPHVGRDENLFDVGGDSLVAAQITGRVLEAVPQAAGLFFDELLRQLLEQPTVAKLAVYLAAAPSAAASAADRPADPGDDLVVLRDGEATTSVLVPDEHGSLLPYADLLDALPSGRVVGLPAVDVDADADLHRLAADHARRIPAGSVHVVGHGLAATLAMEVARIAAERGADVDGLTLVAPRRPAADAAGGLPAATARHEPTLYAGDITVLRPVEPVEFWEDVCIGEVRVAEGVRP